MIEKMLRKEIEKSPLSRYAISKETGIGQDVLSRFMVGERGLSLKVAETLLNYFGYTVSKRKGR